jgi:hypothetical protein
VDEVTEVQSNVRAIADLLEREIRETALMAPESAAICIVDNVNAPDVLYVTDSDAFDFASENRYDLGAAIVNGAAPSATVVALGLESLDIDNRPFYDTDGDGTADSDFQPGAAVIVVDRTNPDRGAACGPIVAGGVDLGTSTVSVDFTLGRATLAAQAAGTAVADLVAVPAHSYSIDNALRLLRNDVVLADDVEDLQLAAFFDLNDDGDVDANEYRGADAAATFPPPAWDNRELREVRFNFVVRSRMPDPRLPGAVFQALENRVAPAGGPDGFRRRAFTAAVRTRNVGHRWNAG